MHARLAVLHSRRADLRAVRAPVAGDLDTGAGGRRAPAGQGAAMTDLTPRLHEVAGLVAEGLTDKQIAARLGIEYNTARIHVAAIAFRLKIPGGNNTRVLIARWW